MAARENSKAHGNPKSDGRQAKAPTDGGFLSDVQDLWQLVVAYFKQETLEPIKGLQRFVGFGLAGSLVVGLGGFLVILGLLRLLQTETGDVFDGNWSWVPYLITLIVAGAGAAAAVKAGTSDRKKA